MTIPTIDKDAGIFATGNVLPMPVRKAQESKEETAGFVNFRRIRKSAQRLTNAAAKASEPGFVAMRDNENDAVYDRL